MRRRTAAIIEEPGESSDNQNETYVSMQRVQPMSSSGRPMINSITMNAREKLYRERIEAMTLDNQSLQRRLNQVSNELDRIQRENEAIVRQIEMVGGDVERFRKLITNKDDVDGQNNIMQQDLQRMKNANLDLNQHLRDEENRTQDATNRLGLASANVKSIEIDYDSLSHDFRQKIQRFDAISREKAMTV
jgi:chromosome segregation ATPase